MIVTHAFCRRVKWGIWFPCWLLSTMLGAQTINSQPLTIQTNPISVTNAFLGSTVSFTVETTGGSGKVHYQWQLNSVNISPTNNATANDQTLVITNVQVRDAGAYQVMVSDNSGSTNSLPANLTISSLQYIGGSDLFINATNIPAKSGNLPLTNIVFRSDNFNATSPNEPGEPRHSGKKGGKSVWYKWTAPFSGILNVTTVGSDFDTLLGIYTGLSVSTLVPAADPEDADDDSADLRASKAILNVTSNLTYFIAVDGYGKSEGNIVLTMDLEPSIEVLPIVASRTPSQVLGQGQLLSLLTSFTTLTTGDILETRWFRDGVDTGITNNGLANLRLDRTNVGSYYIRVKTKGGKDIKIRPTILQINNTISNNLPAFADPNLYTLDKFFDAIDKSTNGYVLNGASPSAGPGLSLESLDPVLESGAASGYTSTQIFSTSSSTKEAGEPNHCGLIGGASEWFSYQAPTSGYSSTPYLRINTDGSTFPTILAVYTNAPPGNSFTNLVPIACDSGHATNGNGSGVYFPAVPGALYYIVIDGVNGAKGSAQLNIYYGDPLTVNGPANQSANPGATVNFVANTVSGTSPSYQWAKNGQTLLNATNSTYQITGVAPSHVGTYSVQVSNLVSSVTNFAALSLNGPPAIISQPVSQTVPVTTDVSMAVQATGSNPLAYQWRFNGANISGATNTSLVITNADPGDAGNYLVVITNSSGSVTSVVAVLTVNTPPSISGQPASQSVVVTSNVTFSVSATGTSPLHYQWFSNNVALANATNPSLTLNNCQTNFAANYLVVVTNNLGSATSFVATLTVLAPPTITSQPASQTVVLGSNVTFSVGVSGTSPFSYQWQSNGVNIAGATASTLTLNSVGTNFAASYSVLVTNATGSAASSAAVLTVLVPPTISVQPLSQLIGVGSNVTFSVTASGAAPLIYRWQSNGVSVAGAAGSGPSLTLFVVQTNFAANYSVVITNSAGSVTSAVAVLTVLAPPAITVQPTNLTVALGSSATFFVDATGTGPLNYQWRFNGGNIVGTNQTLFLSNVQLSNAGNYRVVITNSAGSVTSAAPAVLTVNYAPSITTQPISHTGPAGSSIGLTVVAVGSPAPSYQWQSGGTNLPGATSATLTIPNFQTLNEGSYLVVVTNSLGSVISSNASVFVSSPLRMKTPAFSAGSPFAFQLIGVGGSNYIFQASSNLTAWVSLMTNSDPNGILIFTDPASTNFQRRFYRVQPGP